MAHNTTYAQGLALDQLGPFPMRFTPRRRGARLIHAGRWTRSTDFRAILIPACAAVRARELAEVQLWPLEEEPTCPKCRQLLGIEAVA